LLHTCVEWYKNTSGLLLLLLFLFFHTVSKWHIWTMIPVPGTELQEPKCLLSANEATQGQNPRQLLNMSWSPEEQTLRSQGWGFELPYLQGRGTGSQLNSKL
jgi:hypothetical protein